MYTFVVPFMSITQATKKVLRWTWVRMLGADINI